MSAVLTGFLPVIVVLAILIGLVSRMAWKRGLLAELVTALGLVLSFLGYAWFLRVVVVNLVLNTILGLVGIVAGKVQNLPPGSPQYYIDPNGLVQPWLLIFSLLAFGALAYLSFRVGSYLGGRLSPKPKPAGTTSGRLEKVSKNVVGWLLAGFNVLLILVALTEIGAAFNPDKVNFNTVLPQIDYRVRPNESPLVNWTRWLPLAILLVVVVIFLGIQARGLPVRPGNRHRIVAVGAILVLLAIVVTYTLLNIAKRI